MIRLWLYHRIIKAPLFPVCPGLFYITRAGGQSNMIFAFQILSLVLQGGSLWPKSVFWLKSVEELDTDKEASYPTDAYLDLIFT